MPWLRGGTVSVTNGSTAVTGTNAAFDANARVGDAFVGPDGLNYEIANVASPTVISILPAYKGATVSGAAYAIMPVQGYPKLMVDAFNQLRLQFGDKLAALGTTGNYDILPLAKGGTGVAAASAAAALDALGGMPKTGGSYPVAFSSVRTLAGAQYNQGQGGYVGWNDPNDGSSFTGQMSFTCNRGGGSGGFSWRSVNADNTAGGPVMTYSYAGLLTVPSLTVTGVLTASSLALTAGLPIASGGTGAKDYATAMNNLGLRSGALRPMFASIRTSSTPTDGNTSGTFMGWNESGGNGEGNFICNRGGGSGGFTWRTVNADNTVEIARMTFNGSGSLAIPGTLSQGSDRRLKINDVEIINGLETVLRMRPVEYDRRANLISKVYDQHDSGVIAQELVELLPHAVLLPEDDSDDIWKVNYTALIPYLISAVKQLSSKVDALESQLKQKA